MRFILAVVAAALMTSVGHTQQSGFRPSTATSTATLAVTASSSSTTASNNLLALACNVGTQEAFIAIGPSNVTATTSGMSFPAGFCTFLQLNPGNFIAAITATGSTNLRLTFGAGTAPLSAGASGSTSGTGQPSANATQISGNSTGTTGAVVGTLAAAASKTTYICGFNVSAVGGTAAIGPIVVAGLLGGSQTYQMNAAATAVMLGQNFSPCLPASAANTAITITTTADGTATAVDVNSWGFQQ